MAIAGAHQFVSAAQAVGVIRAQPDPRGYEIMIARRVAPDEIVRVRALQRAIGWRYWPEAKNRPMRVCDCPIGMPRGAVKASRHRQAVLARMAEQDDARADE